MKLIRGLHNLSSAEKGGVITIGNFDGVHLGHQALLAKVKERARALGVPSVVMTFEPQPLEFFAAERRVARLTRWREKVCLLRDAGIDQILVAQFNQKVAGLSPEQFVQHILVDGLGVREVIVGDDFQYGRARAGDIVTLKAAGEQYGFEVAALSTVLYDGERVSSTRIRQALAEADHALAAALLGRPYSMIGRVVHGDKRGRTLGFPTANIHLHRKVSPVQGIYVVRLQGIAAQPLPGVANVGTRPTIGGTRTLLEVHLFDFDQDIYGRRVTVEFCHKLRDEERYANLDLLKEQMERDAEQARHYFEERRG